MSFTFHRLLIIQCSQAAHHWVRLTFKIKALQPVAQTAQRNVYKVKDD